MCWVGACAGVGDADWLVLADSKSPGRRERPRNLLGARANPCTAEDCAELVLLLVFVLVLLHVFVLVLTFVLVLLQASVLVLMQVFVSVSVLVLLQALVLVLLQALESVLMQALVLLVLVWVGWCSCC